MWIYNDRYQSSTKAIREASIQSCSNFQNGEPKVGSYCQELGPVTYCSQKECKHKLAKRPHYAHIDKHSADNGLKESLSALPLLKKAAKR